MLQLLGLIHDRREVNNQNFRTPDTGLGENLDSGFRYRRFLDNFVCNSIVEVGTNIFRNADLDEIALDY
jgi:hypothetical protein